MNVHHDLIDQLDIILYNSALIENSFSQIVGWIWIAAFFLEWLNTENDTTLGRMPNEQINK